MSDLRDEDVFPEESDIEESDIEESDIEELTNNEVDEDEIEVPVNEDEVDANEDDVDANEYDVDSVNLQGGAKKKKIKEDASEADENESSSASEADASEADASEADASEADEAAGAESSSVSDSDEDEDYLQKFNQSMRDDLILNFHPESKSHNYEEIKQLSKVMRNKNGIIMDELHKTIPILTKYEKTRILGQRSKQIETGAIPLVQVPPNIIDSYLIAKLELAQNKIPFIIRRPLPNGGMEYWYVSDLENL